MARKLIVEVVGDSSSYERALNKSATATNNFGKAVGTTSPKIGKLQGTMSAAGFTAVGLAGAGVGLSAVLGGKAVAAASDLNEQISRTEIVMGKSAKAMIEWSETTASSLGISQRAALAAAGTFAGLFQTVGVARPQAAELSQALVKLAADLASLQNSSPEEALIALRSGLAGEAEPLRRFNIFLSETRVAQQALAETGKKTTSMLTQQEKTLARYSLIMKDSVLAQGNFALTSGELANQQRKARAEMDDLAASAGQVLVPAMQAAATTVGLFAGSLNDAIDAMSGLHKLLRETNIFDGWNTGIEEANSRTVGFLEGLRDGIPGMQEFLDLRDRIIDFKGDDSAVTGGGLLAGARTRAKGLPEDTSQVDKDRAKTAQDIIDRITKQAAAQDDLNVQLANSEKRAAHLRDLIRADPNNAKLQQRLTAELKKQNDLRESQSRLSKQAVANAKSEADAAKRARQERERERREREKQRAENRRAGIKRDQFKALGLTAEGLKPTPGAGSLLQRALGLEERVKGTVLDTPKVNSQLKKIVAFLKKNFGKAGKDVREAILGMLNDISGAFDKGAGGGQGPLTKGSGLNVNRIVAGLGLSPEEERELKARLSHVGAGGRVLPRTGSTAATRPQGESGRPIVVESHTTINLDGQRVANVVTRNQQKTRRRNPKQKRGPHRN